MCNSSVTLRTAACQSSPCATTRTSNWRASSVNLWKIAGAFRGPFAIAYSNLIAKSKSDPSNVSFDESKLRNHILSVLLNNENLTDFPETNIAVTRCQPKLMHLTLNCSCRTIWSQFDDAIYDRFVQNQKIILKIH